MSNSSLQHPAQTIQIGAYTLSSELWINIFEMMGEEFVLAKPNLLAIARVCRLFNDLATPIIYRAISLNLCRFGSKSNMIERLKGLDRLVETLRLNPRLRAYVRDLGIAVEREDSDDAIALILEPMWLVSSNVSVFTLWLNAHLKHKNCEFLQCITKIMKHAEQVCLVTPLDAGILNQILDSDESTRLHTLELRSISQGAPTTQVELSTQHEGRPLSRLRHLKLHSYSSRLEAFKRLLAQPEALISLDLKIFETSGERGLVTDEYDPEFPSVNTMQCTIDPHSDSLEELRLGCFQIFPLFIAPAINFESFIRLKLLRLCMVNFFSGNAHTAWRRWLIPTLETLELTSEVAWTGSNVHGNIRFDLGHGEWIFNCLRHRESQLRSKVEKVGLALKTIKYCCGKGRDDIPNRVDVRLLNIGVEPDMDVWPWKALEETSPRLEKFGVRLHWSEPQVFKEHWSEMMPWRS